MHRTLLAAWSALVLSAVFAGPAAADDQRSVVLHARPSASPASPRAVARERVLAPEAAVVALSSPCSEVEPNQATSQASPLSLPSNCGGSVSSVDASSIKIRYDSGDDGIEDVFVLTLPVPAQVTLEVSGSNPGADLDLFLFTSSGSSIDILDAGNHDAPGQKETITLPYPLPAGTYYVGISAFAGSTAYTLTATAIGFSETCTPDATSVCLCNGRFRVRADWTTGDGKSGQGKATLLTHETGWFWFFNASNVEVVVKLLDACGFNNTFWVFSGGLTDVNVRLHVTDTVMNVTKDYVNPPGTPYQIITDTSAFSTCNTSCSYATSPSSQSFGATGGSGSLSVTAGQGCAWTASSDSPWITVTSGNSGSGNGTVAYTVSTNATTSSRSGTLTAAGRNTVITQSGASQSCTYAVTPLSQAFGAAGGSNSVAVTTQAGCAWSAVANGSWITINSGASGSGNGSVGYSVAANSSTTSRSGSMTIAGKTVTITQSGTTPANCTYSLSAASKSVTWCGGDGSVEIATQSGCAFTVTSNASWIQPLLLSGTGNSTGSFAIAANTSASARQGTITIADQTLTINQAGQSVNGLHDGLWSGQTNGGRPVSVCVANETIQALRVTVRLEFPTWTCTTQLVRMTPLPISGTSFSGTIATYAEVSNIFTTVTGTFPSSTSMSGSWIPFSESYFIYCGSTVGFGTGGTSLAAGSFTATKQ